MRAHCPKCGDIAKFVSQQSRTIGLTEAIFKCQGPKCGAEVVADIQFSVRKTPEALCFSAAEKHPDKQIVTDC